MENPSFYLEGVVREKNELQDFEGPLSLILMLLSKNKIEIRDIKISEILDQYLEYLDQMQKLDLEIASEFVQMASHLLYIKTKTLLTQEEEVSELEILIASLEQLKSRDTLSAVKQVIPQLKEASELGLLYFSKLPAATLLSEIILKKPILPVLLAWIPPQNSADGPKRTTRTLSPYFSPKRAMAPRSLASSIGVSRCSSSG